MVRAASLQEPSTHSLNQCDDLAPRPIRYLTRSALWGDAFVQGAWQRDCTHKCFDPFYFEPLWWALHLVVVTYAERLGWPVVDPRQQAAALGHLRGNKHHGFACVSSAG